MAPEPATLLWPLHWTIIGLPCGVGGSILIDARYQGSMLLVPSEFIRTAVLWQIDHLALSRKISVPLEMTLA